MDLSSRSPTSTVPEVPGPARERRDRWLRRLGLGAFAAMVLLGATGVLGVRSETIRARDGELSVTLTHAAVARPGLAVPFRLEIVRSGGFDGPIEIALDTEHLAAFDENGRNPEPDASSSDDRSTIWTFGPPDGSTLVVWLDVRIEPGVQWRVDGQTVVTLDDGTSVLVDHPMWILP